MIKKRIEYTDKNKYYNPYNTFVAINKHFKFEKYGYLGCPNCFKNVRDIDFKMVNEVSEHRIKRICNNDSCCSIDKVYKEIKFICELCHSIKKEKYIYCQENFQNHLRNIHNLKILKKQYNKNI